MIDMHYDMLSVIYQCYIRENYSYIEKWIKHYNSDNVSGLIANLYFMNEEEMKKEIGNREINVLEMFKVTTEIFKKYLPDTKVVFSIEGCDYSKDTNELEELYKLGLRSILLVWNNPNKYGSGNRDDYGLTDLGKDFLIKAIDLGIIIDMSHMNRKTFSDTVELLREQKDLGKGLSFVKKEYTENLNRSLFLFDFEYTSDKLHILAVPATGEEIYFEIYGVDQFGALVLLIEREL